MVLGIFWEKMKKILHYLKDRDYRFLVNSNLFGYPKMDDKTFLERKYKIEMGKELHLESPETFNEKLQWLKIYDRRPEYTKMVDKYAVKDYVASLIGEEYIIPTLGVWDRFEDIDFESLPEKFVLKCTHDSGGLVICKDKGKLNMSDVKKTIRKSLRRKYYLLNREWPYKNVIPRILAEPYMEDDKSGGLTDYKFQCFNGEVDHILVCVGRGKKEGVSYYYFDKSWSYLEYSTDKKLSECELKALKPHQFEEMLKIVEVLSSEIPEIRVDLYEICGKVYFGELTFYTQGGFDTSITPEADEFIGKRLVLPIIK